MKSIIIIIIIFGLSSSLVFGQSKDIKLFMGFAPGETINMVETVNILKDENGLTDRHISNVTEPTIHIYEPLVKNLKAAVIVCPGGGYSILSYDKEGVEICEWLKKQGVTAVLLKYRVPARMGQPRYLAALQDIQRAIRYVRFNAEKLNVAPDKIGVMGFSAGAHLSVMASTAYELNTYKPEDEMDKISPKPNFSILIYPAYLGTKDFQPASEIKINKDVPPAIIVQTADDNSFVNETLFYYSALRNAGANIEMHLYPSGGHGYGLRSKVPALQNWNKRVEEWLNTFLNNNDLAKNSKTNQ